MGDGVRIVLRTRCGAERQMIWRGEQLPPYIDVPLRSLNAVVFTDLPVLEDSEIEVRRFEKYYLRGDKFIYLEVKSG